MVALLAYSMNQQNIQRNFSQHNLAIHHNTIEYSVAYFGFEELATLTQFIQ